MRVPLLDRYAGIFERHRLALALGVAALTALALLGVSRLGFQDVPRDIFRSDDEVFQRLEQVLADFGSDDGDCLCVLEADDWFTPERIALLRELHARLGALEGVDEVLSLERIPVFDGGLLPRPLLPGPGAGAAELERARRLAAEHPLVANQLLSRDGRTLLVVARLSPRLDTTGELRPVVLAVGAELAALTAGRGVRARLTGIPTIRVEIFDVIETENTRLFVLACLLGFFMAWLALHRLGALLPASAAAVVGALWGLGAVHYGGGELDLLKSVLPSVVLVIGLTDAVHLVMDMRHGRQDGLGPVRAAGNAIRHLGLACFLTTLTTAIGFASLGLSRVGMIRDFGLDTATAVGLTWIAVMTVTPLLASLAADLGRARGGPGSRLRRVADGLIDFIQRRPGPIALAGVAVTLGFLALGLGLEPDNRLTEVTPRDRESFQALTHIDQSFGGSMFVGVQLEWEPGLELTAPEVLAAMDAARGALEQTPPFAGALCLLDLFESLPNATPAGALELLPPELVARFARPDLGRALIHARLPDLPSSELEGPAAELELRLDELEREFPGIRLDLTGTTLVARRNVEGMILDFALGLGLAAIVIFAVISLVLRSPRLGLISLVPNIFPLVFAAAVLRLTGQSLQMVSVVSFTILLGIAVDDTIHLLSRYRHELERGADPATAIRHSIHRVGSAILVTTAILTAGFGAMLVSEVPTNRLLGWVSCLGFAAALVGDLVLLPALLIRFGGGATRSGSEEDPS